MQPDTTLEKAQELMLVPTGVGLRDLEQAMGRLMSRQLDYADLYCQSTRYETWTVEEVDDRLQRLLL